MTYTGFVIRWRQGEKTKKVSSWPYKMITGNITTTTIRGLSPNTTYEFGISGLNEDQNSNTWYDLDLYGRRNILGDALEGPIATTIGHTLMYDIEFNSFDANSTQNHGPVIQRSSIGPTGIRSGEGHYGLILVGHSNIQNCNTSSFCCDSFDTILGKCKDESTYVCMGTITSGANFLDGDEDIGTHPLPGNGKTVMQYNDNIISNYYRELIDSPCGPALRLTSSKPQQVGAAWYPRQVEVGEGFETNFTFRISNPSLRYVIDDISIVYNIVLVAFFLKISP
jgi:hypothetical protein